MAVWEPSTYWNTLIADCGLYTGPWPPPMPLYKNLPLDAGEVDYLICLPNPSGVAGDAADGSYATVYYDNYVYWSGDPGTTFGARVAHGSDGGAVDTGSTPVGAHLYMLWYDVNYNNLADVLPPSATDPLTLVPADLVDGGLGWTSSPTEGHWSEWVTGDTIRYPPFKRTINVMGAIANDGAGVSAPGTVVSFPANLNVPLAATVTSVKGGGTSRNVDELRTKFNGATFEDWSTDGFVGSSANDSSHWGVGTHAVQGVATYTAVGWEDQIESSGGILGTEQIDYGENPTTGSTFDYESTTATFVGWYAWDDILVQDFGARITEFYNNTAGGTTPTGEVDSYTATTARIVFRVLDTPITTPAHGLDYSDFYTGAQVSDTLPWVGPTDGTVLGYYPLDSTATPTAPVYGTAGVALNEVTADTFTLVSRIEYLDGATGSAAVPDLDFSIPAYSHLYFGAGVGGSFQHGKGVTAAASVFNVDNFVGTYQTVGGYGLDDTTGTLPQCAYQKPRWRYWIPAYIAPDTTPDPGPFWPAFKLDSGFKGSAVKFD